MAGEVNFDLHSAARIGKAVKEHEGQNRDWTSRRPRIPATGLPAAWECFAVRQIPGADQYYTGDLVLFDGTTETPLVTGLRGAAMNGQNLIIGSRYPCRITPTVDAHGLAVWSVWDGTPSPAPGIAKVNGPIFTAAQDGILYDAVVEFLNPNAAGGGQAFHWEDRAAIWLFAFTKLQDGVTTVPLIVGDRYGAIDTGQTAACQLLQNGNVISRELFIALGPWVNKVICSPLQVTTY